jgi:hypothetical protein
MTSNNLLDFLNEHNVFNGEESSSSLAKRAKVDPSVMSKIARGRKSRIEFSTFLQLVTASGNVSGDALLDFGRRLIAERN